ELREERALHAIPGLVAGPELVAKRLDDVVGRDAEVRGSLLDHLQDRMQHADHGAEGLILALGKVTPAVELAEQLVRAVYQMNDHGPRMHVAARSRSKVRSRALRVSDAARSNSGARRDRGRRRAARRAPAPRARAARGAGPSACDPDRPAGPAHPPVRRGRAAATPGSPAAPRGHGPRAPRERARPGCDRAG